MKKLITFICFLLITTQLFAADLAVGDPAPKFKLKNQDGRTFDLESRIGKWTVLYFYPKAETPGCTKQACAFRDNIKKITSLNADVYGISTNNVSEQKAFHLNHKLNFDLLADPEAAVANLYGSKMNIINMSKRWTFIIDPKLVIRGISRDVDPVLDSERVAKEIAELQKIK